MYISKCDQVLSWQFMKKQVNTSSGSGCGEGDDDDDDDDDDS